MFIQRMLLIVASVFVFVSISGYSQDAEWRDPFPHRELTVTVENGVQLEALDWGGSGKAVVLLAGLGDTAHVFDDFAPILVKRYRVVGVTRRGFGRSSAPSSGYDFPRLAEDIVRVIEELGLDRPIIAGHSFAGEEMHILGARHSAKISGLIYIDAAFNRADGSEDYDAIVRKLPPPLKPQASDLASMAALRTFLTRIYGAVPPEAYLRSRYAFNPDGSVSAEWMPAAPVRQAITAVMQKTATAYNPERIRVPALALYPMPRSANELMLPWYKADDPAIRENVDKLYVLARERIHRHAKWFRSFAEQGRVSEMSGNHYLFLTSVREVLREIDAFISSLK